MSATSNIPPQNIKRNPKLSISYVPNGPAIAQINVATAQHENGMGDLSLE
jgi:hypothetical protein